MMKNQKTKIKKSPGRSVMFGKGAAIRAVSLLTTFGILVSACLFLSCGKKADEEGAEVKPSSVKTASPAEVRKTLEKLVGRWRRPDGGYVIDIRSVRANGELDAGYFNPRPINVSKATATAEGGKVKVFVELYDERYPGSTYDLTYDPRSDVFMGTYFQASIRQDFDVVFVRMKQ